MWWVAAGIAVLVLAVGAALLLAARRPREELSAELAERVAEHLRTLTGNPEAGVSFDAGDGRWLVHVPVGAGGCVVIPLARRPRTFRGLVQAAYELFADGAPAVVDRPQDAGAEEVLHCERHAGWRRWLPCEACGGHWLALGLDPLFQPVHARMLALYRPRPQHCLQCESLRVRAGNVPAEELWFDTVTGQWFTWRAFGEAGGGASWPTGIAGYYPPPLELEPVREALSPRPIAVP